MLAFFCFLKLIFKCPELSFEAGIIISIGRKARFLKNQHLKMVAFQYWHYSEAIGYWATANLHHGSYCLKRPGIVVLINQSYRLIKHNPLSLLIRLINYIDVLDF